MKILLAVDGSDYTRRMLAYIGRHPALSSAGNAYTALTVRPALPGRASTVVGKDVVEDYHAEEAAKVIEPVREMLQQAGIEAETSWQVGPPGETIARVADDGQYDLIVMGSHGHGAIATLVMGSVANTVVRESKVPVLLVR
jgi:nucleotide-binding universal stress UspA family protein